MITESIKLPSCGLRRRAVRKSVATIPRNMLPSSSGSVLQLSRRQCSIYIAMTLDHVRTVLLHTSRWRYSPGWALVSATICLQVSRFLALSLHSFIPIFLRSMDTSSSHPIPGLPLHLVAYSFPYSTFFGIEVSCILSIFPNHLILWHLINLTMFSPLIMASNSSFCRVLHN